MPQSNGYHITAIAITVLQLRTFGGLWLTGGDPRFDGREGLRRQLLP